MNQLNETLARIRRQKAIYNKKLEESNDVKEQQKLSRNIFYLKQEEKKILKELGV